MKEKIVTFDFLQKNTLTDDLFRNQLTMSQDGENFENLLKKL